MMSIELFSCAVSARGEKRDDRAGGGQQRNLVAAHHAERNGDGKQDGRGQGQAHRLGESVLACQTLRIILSWVYGVKRDWPSRRERLRDGGAARDGGRDDGADVGRHAGLAPRGPAREGRGARLPRPAVRPRDPLYQAKNQRLPPSIDALVQGHYLRKKYKDPITNDDFVPFGAAGGAPGQVGPGRAARASRVGGADGPVGTAAGQPARPQSQLEPASRPRSGGAQGGIIGVPSKSTAESIRVYQGRTHYNEWPFVFVNAQPGGPGGPGGRGVPGGPGGRGQPRRSGRTRTESRRRRWRPRPNPGGGLPTPNPRRSRRPWSRCLRTFEHAVAGAEPVTSTSLGAGSLAVLHTRDSTIASCTCAAHGLHARCCRASDARGWSAARRRDPAPDRSRATCR